MIVAEPTGYTAAITIRIMCTSAELTNNKILSKTTHQERTAVKERTANDDSDLSLSPPANARPC
ncbi:MAG: hypothetical protein AAFO84_12400, partial [Cyanobacteria bacterium J06598_1]